MKILKKIFLISLFLNSFLIIGYDVTLVGRINFADGIGRIPISIIDMVKNELEINFISTRANGLILNDISKNVKNIIKKNANNMQGKIAILCEELWYPFHNPIPFVPKKSIRAAYSMFESTKISKIWVDQLNTNFDMVLVPDSFLVNVYKESGVTIPIFVLPIGLYLDRFFNQPKIKNAQFTFGMTAAFHKAKNQELAIQAFAETFGNNRNVSLHIHGRNGKGNAYCKSLKDKINKLKVNNIKIIETSLTQQQLVTFMASLDCYILLSKGEGFSITPREMLAMGIPCILSNNTAHKTICDSGFVKAVPSEIFELADYKRFGLFDCGYQFNCKVEDVKNALKDVYNNYSLYIEKANAGKKWVSQYKYQNVKELYLSLLKPNKIILGDKNEITTTHIITDSKTLFDKYSNLS